MLIKMSKNVKQDVLYWITENNSWSWDFFLWEEVMLFIELFFLPPTQVCIDVDQLEIYG